MGAGPGRCKKCSPGYQQVGSKCLGECPATQERLAHHELTGAGLWTGCGKEGRNVAWAGAEGCQDVSEMGPWRSGL